MAFELIDPKRIANAQRAATIRRATIQRKHRQVSLTARTKTGGRYFVLGVDLLPVIGTETTHIAVEVDAEAKQLAIRPSVWGEPALKLTPTGGGKNLNRSFAVGSILRHLGADVDRRGKLKTTVKDGRIVVDLKPLFKQSA